jgi:EmrB/QacA subfamily drug resistance transporter
MRRPGPGRALALICAAQFVLQLDFSIVNVALPTIQHHLRFAAADLQWVVTGYALTFGSLLLVGGRIADLLGRRRLLSVGLVMFAIASLGAGVAGSSLTLIIARIVQGTAGAMVSPAALSLLTTLHREGPERNRALGIWQATTASGATTGIMAGGLLTQFVGWRAIFLVNPPLIAMMLVFVGRLLPASEPTTGERIDVRGALLVSLAIAALIFGLSYGQQHSFGSVETIGVLMVALLLAGGFIVAERAAAAPMLPFTIFDAATRRAAVIAMVLMGAVVAGYVYFVSLYLQRVLGFSPVATGLALVPATATVAVTSTLGTRRLLAHFGIKVMLLAGLASIAVGQLWLAQITAGGSYAIEVLPGLLFTAFGMGLAFPTASIAITTGIPPREQGLASGLFATSQQVGAAIGLAVLATAAAARSAHADRSLTAGYRLAFLIATGIIIAAGVIVAAQLNARACREELARQQTPPTDAT